MVKSVHIPPDDEMQNYLISIRKQQTVILKQLDADERKAKEVVLAEERRREAELAEEQAKQEAIRRAAEETPE